MVAKEILEEDSKESKYFPIEKFIIKSANSKTNAYLFEFQKFYLPFLNQLIYAMPKTFNSKEKIDLITTTLSCYQPFLIQYMMKLWI